MRNPQPLITDMRKQRGANARAGILRVADRLFAERGLDGAKTEAIAAAAGINKALLFYYFKSKDALFRAVMENHLEEFHRQASAVLSERAPAPDVLLRYLSMHFDFIAQRPHYPALFLRLLMTDAELAARLTRRHFQPRARQFEALIRRGVREGSFRPVDSTHAALSLIALVVFYFSAAPMVKNIAHISPFSKVSLEKRKREVLEFVRFGLFREREAPRS